MARKVSNVSGHVLMTSVIMAAITAVGSMPFVQGDDGTYAGNVDESIASTEEMAALRQVGGTTPTAEPGDWHPIFLT